MALRPINNYRQRITTKSVRIGEGVFLLEAKSFQIGQIAGWRHYALPDQAARRATATVRPDSGRHNARRLCGHCPENVRFEQTELRRFLSSV